MEKKSIDYVTVQTFPIRLLGLIVKRSCPLGVNIFAVLCLQLCVFVMD